MVTKLTRLDELKRFVAETVNPRVIDPATGGWLHFNDLRSYLRRKSPWSAKAEQQLLRHGQALLCVFADSPDCRKMRPRWSNLSYGPPGPCGDYQWTFYCEMVHHLLRPSRAFRRGVAFGREPAEPYRDANPYRPHGESYWAWDAGYILGLNWDRVTQWVRQRPQESA